MASTATRAMVLSARSGASLGSLFTVRSPLTTCSASLRRLSPSSLHNNSNHYNNNFITNRRSFFSTSTSTSTTSTSSSDTESNSTSTSTDGKTTHFGFKTVPIEEKASLVGKVFSNVASKYDLMNDLMSAGIHRWWKTVFIERLGPVPGMKLLDVAGGTGDIAFKFMEAIRNSPLHFAKAIEPTSPAHRSSVLVCDINKEMLAVGKQRASEQGLLDWKDPTIDFLQGDAHSLPIPDASVDVYTIAFGIRNCTDIPKVLREAHRVLKPGGRFMCLEFSKVESDMMSWLYSEYSFKVIPWIGELVANDRDSYQYLVESIARFPSQIQFEDMIREAGFKAVTHENLTFGVVAIHSGFKL